MAVRARVRVRTWALVTALSLALISCGGEDKDGAGEPAKSSGPPPVPAPKADWRDCPLTGQPTRECTTLKVPVDAAKPGSGTLDLAVSRLPATDLKRRIGALVMDPGGPGLPGLYTTANLLPPQIRALFDVVGFDRRGSGASTPFDCGEPAGAVQKLEETDFADLTKADVVDPTAVERSAKEYITKCRAKYGELTAHLGSRDVVADLESIRLALGEDKLSLQMVSYGTLVAQEYLREHPDRVRATVLDGTLDPALTGLAKELAGAVTLEEASATSGMTEEEKADAQLRARTAGFRSWCSGSGPAECAIAPKPEEVLKAVSGKTPDLLKAADAVMVVPSDWPGFSRAVAKAQDAAAGDKAAYADLKSYAVKGFPKDVAAALKSPGHGGGFDQAVRCQDYAWPETTAGFLKEVTDTATRTGLKDNAAYTASVYAVCPSWPRSGTPLGPIAAKAAPKPLVLNSEHDVRTPLAEAKAVAARLPASLVRAAGQLHGLAQSGNPCVNTAVLNTLVEARTPKAGTCPAA
ncbi:alpha/beta fold hydrolase [Streptomyces sp. NPDC048442]|uniref:alpha/beta fold hydrolase n=1 Tax=Streptomyces sp. NPDC048442 TaxID=3154823 RepID=UPI00341502EE